MEPVAIEWATREDREGLADILCADIRDSGPTHQPVELLPLVDATLEVQGRTAFCWVARTEEHALAGVILAFPMWSLKIANRALWLEGFYVKPRFRRQGLGRQLLNFLMDWAEENGIKGIEVESYRMSAAASVLFRENGFKRLAHERYCYHFD